MTSRARALPLVGALLLAGGCGLAGAGEDEGASTQGPTFRGTVLERPVERPDVTLTATDGQPYDLDARTAGRVTLVLPIFTHCDDECPTQMADIAAGLERLPADVADTVDVVAVTTDPERDTPAVLREWLDRFDTDFVGLTGTPEELSQAYRALGIPDAEPETPGPDGGYQVRHVVQAFAFGTDDVARIGYPLGVTPGDYVHDLRLLAAGQQPPEVGAEERAQTLSLVGGSGAVDAVSAFGAYLDADTGDLTVSLATGGSTPDRLVGAQLGDGTPVRLVGAGGEELPLDDEAGPVVAPSEVLLLGPEAGSRLVVDAELREGEVVPLVLTFAEAGQLRLDVLAGTAP